MRRFLLLLALIVSTSSNLGCQEASLNADQAEQVAQQVQAQTVTKGGIDFVVGLEDGLKVAESTGRPILMFFTAEWCTFCHQMEDDAFRNAAVQALASRFTCITIDADAEPKVCRKFGVSGFPTIQLFSPDGQPLQRLKGRQSAQQLQQGMNAALERFAWLGEPTSELH
ncbi:MAG: thioredoxin family protein [Lacipirellulaceae bacterium]